MIEIELRMHPKIIGKYKVPETVAKYIKYLEQQYTLKTQQTITAQNAIKNLNEKITQALKDHDGVWPPS